MGIHWNDAIIHKHRIKFWTLFSFIHIIYPIILLSFCWNIIDCGNIIEYKIYLIINPFVYILWFLFCAQFMHLCFGPSPIRKYNKCAFIAESVLSNWAITISIWCLFGLYVSIKMIYFAFSHHNFCKNTLQSLHLFIGFNAALICQIILVIVISKEQCQHFILIYGSNSISLPWNSDNAERQRSANQENETSQQQEIEQRDTKYNFFGSAVFETYFNGISTKLDTELNEDKECTICMDDILCGDQMVILICNHKFHEKCIVEWLKSSGMCPLCRTDCCKDEFALNNV